MNDRDKGLKAMAETFGPLGSAQVCDALCKDGKLALLAAVAGAVQGIILNEPRRARADLRIALAHAEKWLEERS